jgi:alanine-glyoxylate transaminase / serine-glyoxylate transaminase / serine-pyruvate transaminase
MPVIDHRSPEFAQLANEVLEGLKDAFGTRQPVLIYPASGTGTWEAAIVNTLQPGDHVLMAETGHFATLWRKLAEKHGISTQFLPGDWRDWADPEAIREALAADRDHRIKAVMVVHNETSTGVVSPIKAVRAAIDAENHPALLMVDAISSIGSVRFEHDAWNVDVTVSCSQKGLMLPPGLGFIAVSERARQVAKAGGSPRSYWDWEEMTAFNASGYFPSTPATNLLFGLKEVLRLMRQEGLDNVFSRHTRLAAATRAAVQAWGLEVLCRNGEAHSPVLTAVLLPEGYDSDALRTIILDRYNLSLGQGLSKVKGKVFRIGHLGQCNELSLLAALAGVEMGLGDAGVPHQKGGVQTAMSRLSIPDERLAFA